MNNLIITASELIEKMPDFKATKIEIRSHGQWCRVEKLFVKHGIRPYYSPKGEPFVTVDSLTEAMRAELHFQNEAA